MKESIFWASIRAFFVSLFAVLGILISFVLIVLFFAVASKETATEPEKTFSPVIVANAKGERKAQSDTSPVILKLNIHGIIGLDPLTTDAFQKMLIESREDTLKDRVKGIILSINSPGGTVSDADGIYRALKSYKEQYKVPIYAYADGICASGGLYVAMAADEIYSSDATLIGSVGVLSPSFFNVTQLLEKIGVQSMTISAGKDKDMLNPVRPWKPNEGENLQQIVDDFYQTFVNIIVENRPEMSKEKLIEDYGAKIFTAKQSQEIGFINATKHEFRDALKMLLAKLNIEDDNYHVMEMQKKTWINELFPGFQNLSKGQIIHQIQLPPELDSRLMNQFLYLYRPAGK